MNVLRSRVTIVTILLAGVLGYPIVVLARSAPSFPSQEECVVAAKADGDIELVFGRFTTERGAEAMAARVRAARFHPTVALDDCGRLVVATTGYTSLAAAQAAAASAARRGLSARPEVASAS